VIYRKVVLCLTFAALVAFAAAVPADAKDRIRVRVGGKTADTVVIDETSTPPMITVSSEASVRGRPDSVVPLGNGQYEILLTDGANYHIKTRGGVDSVTIIDGPGTSTYWIGVGADDDTVLIHDGPGDDEYKVEGKGGDDVYDIFDDSGDGNDLYYVKGAKGADVITIADGAGDDLYKVKARPEATLVIADTPGDDDEVRTKGIDYTP